MWIILTFSCCSLACVIMSVSPWLNSLGVYLWHVLQVSVSCNWLSYFFFLWYLHSTRLLQAIWSCHSHTFSTFGEPYFTNMYNPSIQRVFWWPWFNGIVNPRDFSDEWEKYSLKWFVTVQLTLTFLIPIPNDVQ